MNEIPIDDLYAATVDAKPFDVDWHEAWLAERVEVDQLDEDDFESREELEAWAYRHGWTGWEPPSEAEIIFAELRADLATLWGDPSFAGYQPDTEPPEDWEVVEEMHDLDPDMYWPLMNYAYPLPEWRLARQRLDRHPHLLLEGLPVVLVELDGQAVLALSGGGMDLTWEIAEAYMRLGYLPPLHFCDLPAMADRPRGATDAWIMAGCEKSAQLARDWAQAKANRVHAMRRD